MPVTQDRLTRLREFGLSEYAARSYLALLDLGIAEARDVSSISKVPQAKIYHVLEQLHDKGLVVILPEFPKKYAPVPFQEYLGRLYDEHTKAAQSIDEQRAELAELFRVMGDTDVGDRGFFTVIRGRRNVLARIEEMVAQTKNDLLVLGTAGTAARASHMIIELRRARERNVRVRVMTPLDEETLPKLESIAQTAELRARELGDEEQSGKVAIVVSDAARAFLIHFVPDDANLYTGKDIGVFTDQEAMVAAIQAIVEPHWSRASPYERRRAELLEGRAAEFTRIYASAAEASAAVEASLARGAKEALLVDIAEAGGRAVDAVAGRQLLESGLRWRAALNFADLAALDEYASIARKEPKVQLRHVRAPGVVGMLLLDDREAFFTLGEAPLGPDADVVVHTNAPAVLRRLREHFDGVWSTALELEERRRDLEIFPALRPGDIGIGRLFQLLRDAVVVGDPKDDIVLWNPSAVRIFGRDAAAATGRPLATLVPESERKAFLERLSAFRARASRDDDAELFTTAGERADGQRFPMEITLSMLTARGKRYVIAVCRDITTRLTAAPK